MVHHFLYFYYLLLKFTCRLEISGLEKVSQEVEAGAVPVFTTPHHCLLPSILSYDGRPAALIASRSKDGELVARLLARRGFQLIRGSSGPGKGGAEGLAALISGTRQGRAVGIVFDGPKGPPLIPKRGTALCAWNASRSLYLVISKPDAGRLRGLLHFVLGSWDRFLLPLPFCALRVSYERYDGDPAWDEGTWRTGAEEWLRRRGHEEFGALYDDVSSPLAGR